MSNINYLNINENFPIEGQDNDTQVFRDNFDSIKTALRIAKEEIGSLEDLTVKKDEDVNFNNNLVSGAIFQDCKDLVPNTRSQSTEEIELDFQHGSYQRIRLNQPNAYISFVGLTITTPVGVSKLTLELISNQTTDVTFISESSNAVKSNFSGNRIRLIADTSTIIEVWQYELETIFIKLVGEFS